MLPALISGAPPPQPVHTRANTTATPICLRIGLSCRRHDSRAPRPQAMHPWGGTRLRRSIEVTGEAPRVVRSRLALCREQKAQIFEPAGGCGGHALGWGWQRAAVRLA